MGSIDFLTVPTATFRVLYAFLVLSHDRRSVVYWNVTSHPGAQRTAQQIVEAFRARSGPSFVADSCESFASDEFVFEATIGVAGLVELSRDLRNEGARSGTLECPRGSVVKKAGLLGELKLLAHLRR